MMIARMKFDFSEAPWGAAKPRESVRRAFKQIAAKPKADTQPVKAVEHMSLGELLYMIMMNEQAAV